MRSIRTFREAVAQSPIVPVLVVPETGQAAWLARVLANGGVRAVEVTLRTPNALEVITAMKAAVPDLLVGVGTLLSEGDVDASLKAGADFLVSPGASPQLLTALAYHDGAIVPGVSTASEAMARFEEGYGLLKFFPAGPAGGVKFLKSLAGPLPHIDFMPTGGVSMDNLGDYLALPNVVAVGGSWLATSEDLERGDWAGIEQRAREALALAHEKGRVALTR